jgi:hypothetical protein
MIVTDGGAPKLSLLWKSSKLMDETRGDAQTKKLQLSGKAVCGVEKQSSSSLQKSVTIYDYVVQVPLEALNIKGLNIAFLFFIFIFIFIFYILLSFLVSFI